MPEYPRSSTFEILPGDCGLANTYIYDSFGNLTSSTGTVTNPFQYTAREYDSETGLYYYRARYYDSSVGRFLSEDPILFNGGNNFYAYAFNNPILLTDPTGLHCFCLYSISTGHFQCSGCSGDEETITVGSYGDSGYPPHVNDIP